MPSVLMTSTMKSDPGMPLTRASSRGVPVSACATCIEGGSAEGTRGAGAVSAARAAAGAVIVEAAVAAPAATTPVRNLRRPTFAVSSRAIVFSPQAEVPAGILIQAGPTHYAFSEVRGGVPPGGKAGGRRRAADHRKIGRASCRERV